MRLFIAINFNADTKDRLQALSDELRKVSSRGRYSLRENLHITLAFLGECGAERIATVKSVMNEIVFNPFNLQIDRIGRFNRNGGDIWWAGVRKNSTLSELHQNLSARLKEQDFYLEARKFSPHITLGREIVTKAQQRQIEPFGKTISRVDLMKSERINGKLTYTAIYDKEGRAVFR